MQPISQSALQALFTAAPAPPLLLVYDSLPSTNDTLKQLAREGAPHGTLCAAQTQTRGRGRLGRDFYSPADSGIYCSILLHKSPADALQITALAALAAAEAIAHIVHVEVDIKWVNDLYYNGKKVCGILAEGLTADGAAPGRVVLGIGVNVTTSFSGPLADKAGCLCVQGKAPDPNVLLAEIYRRVLAIADGTDSAALWARYRRRSLVIGREISFSRDGRQHSGRAINIDTEGALVVQLENGSAMRLATGEISIILEAQPKRKEFDYI